MTTVAETSGNGGGTIGAGPETKGSESSALSLTLTNAQLIAYTGTAGVVSNPIKSEMARVTLSTTGYIAIGASPTALTTDHRMQGGVTEIFNITYGDKISAIRDADSGTLYVSEST